MSPYETLGVEKTANDEAIRKAYRRLTLEYHPDRNQGDARAEERFKDISIAYGILSDPDKRRKYDAGGGRVDPKDLFDDAELLRTVRGFIDTFGSFLDIGVKTQAETEGSPAAPPTPPRATPDPGPKCADCGGSGHRTMRQGGASYRVRCKSCRH
jgi:DnaJ-class molecular chaperone